MLRDSGQSATDLLIRVIPRAGRTAIAGVRNGTLLVRVAAAPVDGSANAELIDLIARALRIPKGDVTLVAGERSRHKRVRVARFTREQLLARLANND